MKRYVALVVVAGVVLGAAAGVSVAAETAVISPASGLTWVDNPVLPGAKQAVLWGDPATGPYGAMKSLPGGTRMGVHSHTHSQRAVLVSGTLNFNMRFGRLTTLGPGSYVFIPGGAEHEVTCMPGADCVYFEEGMGAADFKPKQQKKKE